MLNKLTNEIWKSAKRLYGKSKDYEYQNRLMSMTGMVISHELFQLLKLAH